MKKKIAVKVSNIKEFDLVNNYRGVIGLPVSDSVSQHPKVFHDTGVYLFNGCYFTTALEHSEFKSAHIDVVDFETFCIVAGIEPPKKEVVVELVHNVGFATVNQSEWVSFNSPVKLIAKQDIKDIYAEIIKMEVENS